MNIDTDGLFEEISNVCRKSLIAYVPFAQQKCSQIFKGETPKG